MPDFVKVQIESGVGRLTLNRPDKRNALKRQFIEEIHAGISQLEADPKLRVFLLDAEGSVFCAGMDLAEMQQRADRKMVNKNGNAIPKFLPIHWPRFSVYLSHDCRGPRSSGGRRHGAGPGLRHHDCQ